MTGQAAAWGAATRSLLAAGVLLLLSLTRGDPLPTLVSHEVNTTSGQLDLTFSVQNGSNVTLHLERNDHVTSDMPVFIGRRGQIDRWNDTGSSDFVAYVDQGSRASVLAQQRDGHDTPLFSGNFGINDQEFIIEPKAPKRGDGRQKRNGGEHVVRNNTARDYAVEHDGVLRPELAAKTEEMEGFMKAYDLTFAGKANYGVEMLICVDYPIFRRWFLKSSRRAYRDARDEAIANIKFFYAHVVNNMDLRYRSIQESDYSIYIRLKAIYVATTPEDSYWTETTKYPGGPRRYYTDAYDTLDTFEDWLNTSAVASSLGPFDQATLFTGYTLIGGFSSGRAREIGGLADIRGICSYRKASVNQERGQWGTIQTGAHEMGHNLGALHDGNADNNCRSNDQYIMAISPGALDDRNFDNTFRFSYCSRNYFRSWLNYLTRTSGNCLLNSARHEDPDFHRQLSRLPGRDYSLDEQCRDQLGASSYYCGGEPNDRAMCLRLSCYDTATSSCVTRVEQRAYEGTTCGDRKWCNNRAECVYSSRAPSAKDKCLSGDFRGKVQGSSGNERTCADIGRLEPWDCYLRHNGTCCQTCADIYDSSKPGCEYGDHASFCKRDIRLRDCYADHTRRSCCETCTPIEGAPQGCEFGDRASWCQTLRTRGCYANQETCCSTCERRRDTSRPHCPWGDRATWCSSITRSQCYSSSSTCCASCERYRTSQPNCEFGDRSSYCRRSDCNDRSNWRRCCRTCQAEIRACDGGDRASWCRPSSCYQSWDTCCSTCQRHYTGDINCPYGDRYTWCPNYVSQNDGVCRRNTSVARDCCSSCRRYQS